MRPSNGVDGRLHELMMRALSKIKKPSTSEEITELLNRELGPGDRSVDQQEVENWLRSADYRVVALYWLAIRPGR